MSDRSDAEVRSAPSPASHADARFSRRVAASAIPSLVALAVVVALAAGVAVPLVPAAIAIVVTSALSLVAVVRDARAAATERAAHDEVLAAARRDRHLASLGEVSAVLAHEIRNPLAALKGHAQILAESVESGTKIHAKAERVVNEAVRVEKLTDDLLAFARSGKLRTRSADLCALVNQAVSTVGPESIVVRMPESPTMVDLDAGRMLQLLDNLLRNALRHGKPPVELTVSPRADGIVIEVRDHGKGIPADRLERIFEPFVSDATRGSGLGLAVVRRVAVLHGGSVSASNHEGGGASFRVELPNSAGAQMR